MREIAIHIDDLDQYLPVINQYDKIHIVWFEEIDCMKDEKRLRKKVNHQDVNFWFSDTVWPNYSDKKFLYYLWASSTNNSIDYTVSPTRHFICLNNTPREHRIYFLNEMYKQNLFKNSLISWNNRKNKIKGIDQTVEWIGSNDCPPSILPIISLPMNELSQSALSIVLESFIDQYDISEKIFQCIATAQPFLSYGMHHLYHNLETMGFKKLPIIDYSFDNERDDFKRGKMIIKQLKKLSKYRPAYLKESFRKVSLYNQIKFREIVKTLNLPFHPECVFTENMKETEHQLLLKQKLYQ
jgi:hypothetical protein